MKSALGLPSRPVQLFAWMCAGMYAAWWYHDRYLLQSYSPMGVSEMRFYSALIVGALVGTLFHLGMLYLVVKYADEAQQDE
jgi:hypothetical protein